MKLTDAVNHIGSKVTLNGRSDLAFDDLCRNYIYPEPDIPFVFSLIKITKSGKVYIQCDRDGKFLTVNADNVDLVV